MLKTSKHSLLLFIIRVYKCGSVILEVLSEDVKPTLAYFEVVDNIEFVVVVILWIDLAMIPLPHMVHQYVLVVELFLTVDAFIHLNHV